MSQLVRQQAIDYGVIAVEKLMKFLPRQEKNKA
jgi:hypothetical protein